MLPSSRRPKPGRRAASSRDVEVTSRTPRAAVEAEKVYFDGTHRTVEPALTLERLGPLLPRIGVTRVAVITGLDVIGIPVVMVCRPNGRSLSVSQGKGVDPIAAKVSGIMEALEAWHAEHVLLPLRLATYRELRAVAKVVDVEQLARPSWSRFHPDLSILWIEGTDVLTAERVFVPYECVHLDFRVPGPQGAGCFLTTGTGLAAGNHMLEAVSHALCEVVERDAFSLWDERRASDRAARRIDLGTVTDPGCRRLLDAYEAAGVGVVAWDLTTDVGLAVFAVTIVDRCADPTRRLPAARGGGCHPDRAVALSRALTEAAQSRLTLIAGTRDDCPPAYYRQVRHAEPIATHMEQLGVRPERSFADVPHVPGASLDVDVTHALDRLRAAGVRQAILVDLTRPEVRVPVVRMVVPGLEGWTDKVARSLPGMRARRLQGAG
jgi:YcaO-like protein with predicted kinase domain